MQVTEKAVPGLRKANGQAGEKEHRNRCQEPTTTCDWCPHHRCTGSSHTQGLVSWNDSFPPTLSVSSSLQVFFHQVQTCHKTYLKNKNNTPFLRPLHSPNTFPVSMLSFTSQPLERVVSSIVSISFSPILLGRPIFIVSLPH